MGSWKQTLPHLLPMLHTHDSRYADNFDAVNNLYVVVEKSDKNSIEGYGSPEEFISTYGYLLGKQAWAGRLDECKLKQYWDWWADRSKLQIDTFSGLQTNWWFLNATTAGVVASKWDGSKIGRQ